MSHAEMQVLSLRSKYRRAFVRWHRAKGERWSYRWYAMVERTARQLSAAKAALAVAR